MALTPRITVKGPLTCGSCGSTDFTLQNPSAEVVCPISTPGHARQPAGYPTQSQAAAAPSPPVMQPKALKLPTDVKDRVFQDTLVTTYQADFCGMNEQDIQQHNEQHAQNWVDQAAAAACPAYKVPKRPRSVSYGGPKGPQPPKKDRVHPGKSEYQDTFSLTGDNIMHRGCKKKL